MKFLKLFFKSRSAFTLIELLIVIAIIGILAVAFLPTLLNAPAKGRDATRIADLQKINKILLNASLEGGKGYPFGTGPINDGLPTGWPAPNNTWDRAFKAAFGGKIPTDPLTGNHLQYKFYQKGNANIGTASFGLRAKMETKEAGNTRCQPSTGAVPGDSNPGPLFDLSVKPPNADESCYVIIQQ